MAHVKAVKHFHEPESFRLITLLKPGLRAIPRQPRRAVSQEIREYMRRTLQFTSRNRNPVGTFSQPNLAPALMIDTVGATRSSV